MIYIGNHLSATKGFYAMGKEAVKLGANTFAFFTRNPRGGKAKEIDEKDVQKLLQLMEQEQFGPLVAHAPYTMNLCSDKADIREFAKNMLADDLQRMEYLPGNFYNFHPGSHVGQGAEAGIEVITEVLNEVLWEDMHTTVLLETMAGKGTEIGRNFEELHQILEGVICKDKVGICMDTCHIWDGGYDIGTSLDEVLTEFDHIIGIERLKAIHLNDSMNERNTHKDRHEKLGQGKIGEKILSEVIRHPLLQGKPFVLETPNDNAGYQQEIAWVKTQMV